MSFVYRAPRFEVRPAARLLIVDGAPAPLGARAFDLLIALIERRERVVTKDELLDVVWPGVIVEENNLQVQVSTLRKLLGAAAIATIPGRGYRFTAEVAEVGASLREASGTGVRDRGPATDPAAASVPTLAARTLPPAPRGALVGREADCAALAALLREHAAVTLVGPGGVGKTRLAQELAQRLAGEYTHGVGWVELAPVSDPQALAARVIAALGLQTDAHARAEDALRAALAPLALLIVLDNAEHLIDATAALAADLLAAGPGIRVLTTSQAPLRIDGEASYRLEALPLPPRDASLDDAQRSAAFALLVERARAADRRFTLSAENRAALIDLCHRLDGLPLALHLAAARLPTLGAQALRDAHTALHVAGGRDLPARQSTLTAVYDWSCGLLAESERAVFRRLGVLSGSFSLELAAAVAADPAAAGDLGDPGEHWAVVDAIALLVERSLVSADAGDPPRYALAETARAYALAQLAAAGELESVRRRHAHAVRARFAACAEDWLAMRDADWLARYEPDLDNLRCAFAWAIAHEPPLAAFLAASTAELLRTLSLDSEERRWLEATEPVARAGALPPREAARWWRAAQWAWSETAPARAQEAGARANALYRELGDAHGLYAQLTGIAGIFDAPAAVAQAALAEALSLERPDWPPRERAWGWRARADRARAEGRLEDSRAARETELALRTAAGDERGRQRALAHLADVALALGDVDDAVRRAGELVDSLRGTRALATLATASLTLLAAWLARGDAVAAREQLGGILPLALRFDLDPLAADLCAQLSALEARWEAAAQLVGWADAAHARRGAARAANAQRARDAAATACTAALGGARADALMRDGTQLPREALPALAGLA